jgi:hypothetical protein
MNILRKIVKNANSDIVVSMRDSLRYQTRKNLNVLNDFVYRLVGKSNLMFDNYNAKIKSLPKYADQSECKTFPDLVNLLKSQQEVL